MALIAANATVGRLFRVQRKGIMPKDWKGYPIVRAEENRDVVFVIRGDDCVDLDRLPHHGPTYRNPDMTQVERDAQTDFFIQDAIANSDGAGSVGTQSTVWERPINTPSNGIGWILLGVVVICLFVAWQIVMFIGL